MQNKKEQKMVWTSGVSIMEIVVERKFPLSLVHFVCDVFSVVSQLESGIRDLQNAETGVGVTGGELECKDTSGGRCCSSITNIISITME